MYSQATTAKRLASGPRRSVELRGALALLCSWSSGLVVVGCVVVMIYSLSEELRYTQSLNLGLNWLLVALIRR